MQKKLIALAVAGLASTAAFAQSNVTIYGRMHYSIDSVKADQGGAVTAVGGNGKNTGVSNNSSRIGFRGTEDLGNGLKAGFNIETLVAADEATTAGNGVGSRNTYVTLGSTWGTVLVGKADATYKTATGKFDPFSETIGDYNAIINKLDARVDHAFAYISPNVSGVQVVAGWVPDATSNTATNSLGGGGTDNNKQDAWAATVTYDNGPLSLAATTANVDVAGAATNTKFYKLGGGFKFGPAGVGLVYENAKDIGGVKDTKQAGWVANATYELGQTTLMAQYGQLRDGDTAGVKANNGGKLAALGAKYGLSKRTSVYGVWAKTENDAGGTGVVMGFSGKGDTYTSVAGKDVKAFSLGLIHDF